MCKIAAVAALLVLQFIKKEKRKEKFRRQKRKPKIDLFEKNSKTIKHLSYQQLKPLVVVVVNMYALTVSYQKKTGGREGGLKKSSKEKGREQCLNLGLEASASAAAAAVVLSFSF